MLEPDLAAGYPARGPVSRSCRILRLHSSATDGPQPSGQHAERAITAPIRSIAMQPPRLTFACELDRARLTELFADGSVLADLRTLRARVTLMLSDLSSERAAVVRQLNNGGVPVVAIPLLPFEEGYYFTADNPDRAAARYDEWKAWTDQHGLVWDGVGLDIEPDIRLYQQIVDNPWGLVPMVLPRLGDRVRPRRAAVAYAGLVARMRAE